VAVAVFSSSTLLKRVFCSTLSRFLACLDLSIAAIARVRAAILSIAAAGSCCGLGYPRDFLCLGDCICSINRFRVAGTFRLPRVLLGLGDAKERNWGAWMLPVALESLHLDESGCPA